MKMTLIPFDILRDHGFASLKNPTRNTLIPGKSLSHLRRGIANSMQKDQLFILVIGQKDASSLCVDHFKRDG